MLQILIWAGCVLIFGVGYCAMFLEKLAVGDKAKKSTGQAIFVLMFLLAAVLFIISVSQGIQISNILNR